MELFLICYIGVVRNSEDLDYMEIVRKVFIF